MKDELLTTLDPASQAMLASQSGPYASRAFTTIPCSDGLSFPSHLFRVLLLRRLRLPLPLTERSCRCRRVPRPPWRPPCSVPSVRCSSRTWMRFGTSGGENLPGSGSSSHNQHTPDRPQHPLTPPPGSMTNRSYRQWFAIVSRGPK